MPTLRCAAADCLVYGVCDGCFKMLAWSPKVLVTNLVAQIIQYACHYGVRGV